MSELESAIKNVESVISFLQKQKKSGKRVVTALNAANYLLKQLQKQNEKEILVLLSSLPVSQLRALIRKNQ